MYLFVIIQWSRHSGVIMFAYLWGYLICLLPLHPPVLASGSASWFRTFCIEVIMVLSASIARVWDPWDPLSYIILTILVGSWKHCTGWDKFRCIYAHWFVFPAFQEDRQHFDTPLWGSIDLPEGLCRQLEFEWIWVNCWCEVDGSHWQEAHNIALWDSPVYTKWSTAYGMLSLVRLIVLSWQASGSHGLLESLPLRQPWDAEMGRNLLVSIAIDAGIWRFYFIWPRPGLVQWQNCHQWTENNPLSSTLIHFLYLVFYGMSVCGDRADCFVRIVMNCQNLQN